MQLTSEIPEEFHEEDHHKALAFDYTSAAYEAFLDGNDTYEEQDQMLEARYGAYVVCLQHRLFNYFH
jgi:kinetochore protein NDC80